MHENEPVGGTHFHMNGFVRGLVLTPRQKASWKWPGNGPLKWPRNTDKEFQNFLFLDVIIPFHQVDVCTGNGKVKLMWLRVNILADCLL